MAAIRSKDTGIELILRRELHRKGYRYRLHHPAVQGKPDIAFVREKVAIFCDNEFWHGYHWNELKQKIGSNREYWIPKIERNIARDKLVTEQLQKQGWVVLRFWGQKVIRNADMCVEEIEKVLSTRSRI
jgi:DNA mismatch endonuclease (patch repair protein)